MAKLAIRMPGLPERVVTLPSAGAVLGREPSCDIVLEDGAVGRRHCSITPTPTGYCLTDLGSRNPAMLNDARVAGETSLRTGDLIRLGRVEILFVCAPEESPCPLTAHPAAPVELENQEGYHVIPDESADLAEEGNLPADAALAICPESIQPERPADPQPAYLPPALAETDEPASQPPQAWHTTTDSAGSGRNEGRASYEAITPEDLTSAPLPVFEPIPEAPRTPDAASKPRRGNKRNEEGLTPQEMAELRTLRARNDFWAKIIILLLFGIPALAIDLYLIWYFCQ